MFILFGEKVLGKIKDEGQFVCAHCGNQQSYQHIEEKSYFTLMFIRTFPISTVASYWQCQSCGCSYDPDYIKQPAYVSAMQMILAYLVNAYSDTEPMSDLLKHAQSVYHEMTSLDWQQQQFSQAIQAMKNLSQLNHRLKQHSKYMNGKARLNAVESAFRFLFSIGHTTGDDRILVNMIASRLEIDHAYSKQIWDRLAQTWSQQPD